MTTTKRMPQCVGLYERGEVECDGDPNGDTEADRAPCNYRDRCAAFQRVMKDTGRDRGRIVRMEVIEVDEKENTFAVPRGDPEKLDRLLKRAISKYGIRNGQITSRVAPKVKRSGKKPKADPERSSRAGKSVSAAGRKASAKGRSLAWQKARENSSLLASWLTKRLEEACERSVVATMAEAEAGDFVLVDRLETSRYIALYAKLDGGRRVAVCAALPNARTKRIQIRLAVKWDAYQALLSAANWKQLAPEDYDGKDGAFRTRIMGLDKEGVSIVAESIAEAIRQGIFDLPESG